MGCTQSNKNGESRPTKQIPGTTSGNVARRRSQFESSSASTAGGGGSNKQLKRRQSSNSNLNTTTGGTVALFRDSSSSTLAKPPSNPKNNNRKQSMTVANLPKCKKCNEAVTALEQAKDSKGTIFHATCLKCTECGVKLAARECVSASATRLTSSQYVIADSNKLFCDRHAPMADKARRKNSIKGQDITEKAVDENELKKMGSNRKELNEKAKEVLEESGGFSSELKCGRCGSAITSSQQMTVSGMMRYHQVCPTKEEISKADKSVKYFLEKIPDRLAAVLTCDGRTKKPHTFLYIRNPVSYKEALKQAASGTRQVAVVFDSDVDARDQIPKNFTVPDEQSFDLQLKGYSLSNFSFESPPSLPNDARTKLGSELNGTRLKITKQGLANGIVHSLEGYFHYDEKDLSGTPLTTEKLILLFERPSSSSDDDENGGGGGGPLAALRLKRRGTSNKSTTTIDDDAMTTGSNNSGSTVHTMARRMTNLPQPRDASYSTIGHKLERYDSNSNASTSTRYLPNTRSASSGLALNRYDSAASSTSATPATTIPTGFNSPVSQNGLSPMQNTAVDVATTGLSLDTSTTINSPNSITGTSPGRPPISPNKVVPPPLPKNKPKVRDADMNMV